MTAQHDSERRSTWLTVSLSTAALLATGWIAYINAKLVSHVTHSALTDGRVGHVVLLISGLLGMLWLATVVRAKRSGKRR